MTKARRTEGPRAPLFYSVLLGLSGVASAQTVDMSALESCSSLETEAARLACFEAIVSGDEVAPAASAEADKIETQASAESAAAEPQAESPGVPVEVVPAVAPVAISVERKPAAESVAPASAVPPLAEPAQSAPETMSADDFGREHLTTRSAEAPEALRARVVEVTKGNHDALIFHLDNGQLWRQIQPRYYPYPRNQEFDVTITTGMMGEYQLQVDGKGRKVNIRRLR